MDLATLSALFPGARQKLTLHEWTECVRAVCGRFHPQAMSGKTHVVGKVELRRGAGIEVAHIANDLDWVERGHQEIRTDYGEYLFLLLQLEGVCRIEQCDQRTTIGPGDCVLVDSLMPSRFCFNGRFSNHLSVHLPRQMMYATASSGIAITQRLGAADPMAVVLRALLVKLMTSDERPVGAEGIRELFFSSIHQAFSIGAAESSFRPTQRQLARIEIAQMLIDRHLTEERLTPRWLAGKVGASLRTLQQDFEQLGVSINSMIRTRRLHYARERLAEPRHRSRGTVAEVAYESGFNDISYFNRCFRKVFDCAPSDVASHRAAGSR
ncbi:helix-turn-helix domain-containing protein [Bradyrhizobium tropiciagri]|uniref:helix-turn-helix domain-containing protein n=1 Tax=Bradyrhizobium tropiciagri TaxID=312253 RepID=UPI000AEE1DD8|nr:helix-turn-helix domain-containing protein [Bradyrhizobium tropiciagri]